ncbi:MAG: hypothetical protein AABY22_02775 [Nanoarchaeota archaeon]
MQEKNNQRNINPQEFPFNKDLQSQIKFVLQYAILAPSTHNTQPWLFKITGNKCEVYYDPKLQLPEADPKARDLYISIGCAIENLILAAKFFNIFGDIKYSSTENEFHIATITFKENSNHFNNKYASIVETILKRINARGVFFPKPIPHDFLDKITEKVSEYIVDGIKINWIREEEKIKSLASLTAEGLKIAYKKNSFRKEMSMWMNNSLTKKKEGIPGYALKMPVLLSFILPKLVKFFNIGNFLAKKNYQSLSSAPLIVVITSKSEDSKTWLQIGRLVERLMLEFQNAQWQTSIFVASIEMEDLYKEVKKIINTTEKPQFLFAVGLIDSLHQPTPRHKLNKKIIF